MRLAMLPAVLAVVIATGCGGGEGEDRSDEVAAVAEKIAVAGTDAEIGEACRELLSPGFQEEAYGGSVRKCVERPVNHRDEREDPGVLTVGSVEVDGREAKVEMTSSGGETGTSGGTWTFAEEEGKWRLARIEDDFVRSTFVTSVETVDGGALAFPPVRRCMTAQVEGLPPEELRSAFFQSMRGDRQAFLNALLRLSENCPDAMNAYVADQIATRIIAERGATPSQVRCARRELVPLLDVTGLATESMKASISPDGGASSPVGAALAGLVAGAMKNCPG